MWGCVEFFIFFFILVYGKVLVVVNRMKFLEVFRFFFNDVVVFIYVFVDDNVYSNRIYVCIKEIQSIIILFVNVLSI